MADRVTGYRWRGALGALALLAWGAGRAHAARFDPGEAVAYALAHNPALRAAKADSAASQARIGIARSAGRPQVTAGFGYALSNDPLAGLTDKLETRSVTALDFYPSRLNNPGTSRLSTTSIAVGIPLYTGGGLAAGVTAAQASAAAAAAGLERERQQIAAATLTAYYATLAAGDAVGIARAATRVAAGHVRTTTRLLREGRIVPSDRLTAEVNLGAIRVMQSRAEANLATARAQLRLVMGLPQTATLELADTDSTAVPGIHSALDTSAWTQRPDLQALNDRWRAAHAQVERARAGARPQVGLNAANNWYDTAPGFAHRSWTVMATIRQRLYDGGAAASRETAAADAEEAIDDRRAALRAQIGAQIRQAVIQMNSAREQLGLAEDNIQRARHAVTLVRQRYGEGRTLLLDLLQAEQGLISARLERTHARYELEASEVALALAEGTVLSP